MSKNNSWDKEVVDKEVVKEVEEAVVEEAVVEGEAVAPEVVAPVVAAPVASKSDAKQQFSTRSEAREYAETVGGTVELKISATGTPVWEV
jgi:hypothetical protein